MGDSESTEQVPAQPEGWELYRFKPEATAGGGRYEIIGPLGRGSLGELYRARVAETKAQVNLRWIPGIPDDQVQSLIGRPFPATRHLVCIIDVRASEGGCFVATEPYPQTLRQAIREGRSFSPETAIDRVTSILLALAALEQEGLFPLVVAPESIALWPDGAALDEYYLPLLFASDARPVPLDRAVYLPPDLDPRSPRSADALYGVGSTFHEMLKREPLLSGGPFEIVAQAMQQKYRVEFAEPYGGLVRRLLAPTAGQRYATADSVLRDFGALSGAVPEGLVALSSSPSDAGAASVDANGVRLEYLEDNPRGHAVFVRYPEEVRMVLLPGGTSRMGSTTTDRDNEGPVVEVPVGAFLIDEAPVTWHRLVAMLARAERSHPLNEKRRLLLPRAYGGEPGQNWRWKPDEDLEKRIDEHQPAVMVTHDEASSLAGQLGLELPSEAEWEYAYRGGTTTEYWWGDAFDPECAWCGENASGGPQAVGQMPFNPFGLLDLAGNVAEFCRDFYVKNLYPRVAGADPSLEPIPADRLAGGVMEKADTRSLRGGSWNSSAKSVRAAFRLAVDPDTAKTTAGFRFAIRMDRAPGWAREAFEKLK